MLGKLIPCGGGAPLPLLKTTLLVGRKPECDVTVPGSSVSSRHCMLEFTDGVWWVRDLDSKNGTTVNGHRCSHMKLAPCDVLQFGRQRLIIDYQPVKKAPTQSPARTEEDLAFSFLSEGDDQNPAERANTSSVTESWPNASTSPAAQPAASRPKTAGDLGKLVPCGGGVPIPLRYPELVLGRSRECDVRVKYPSVSSRHCKLTFDDGYWLVEDLNSTNGTWVDGDRCLMQCLMPDSILALDRHRFSIHYIPQGDGPPPVVRQLFSQSLLEKAGLSSKFEGNRLGGQVLPEDDFDRPKKYTLTDADDE